MPNSKSPALTASAREFILGCITDVADRTPYTPTELARALAGLVGWQVKRKGSLTREAVLARQTVADYVASGMGRFEPSTRTNQRSQLLRVAEALLSPELAPRALPAMAPSDPTLPYTTAEEAELLSWAKRRKAQGRGSDALVLLALGFGAGLSAQEVMNVRGQDVTVLNEAVVVRVADGRRREVSVLHGWEGIIKRQAAGVAGEDFLFKPGRACAGKNLISNFVASAGCQGVLPQSQRMRSTWLVTHMAAGTHLTALVEAAGVDSLEALTRYLRFVPAVPPQEARALLRGASSAARAA